MLSTTLLAVVVASQPPVLRHAALHSSDPATAFEAACEVPERQLDLRDIDRYVELTMPRLFDDELRFDFDTFKHVLSAEQVAHVLEMSPGPTSDTRSFFISDLHRSMRPEHIPALCQRVRDDDPVVREHAFGTLANLAIYSDRHRESIATTLLSWPGTVTFVVLDYDDPSTNPRYEPRELAIPEERTGYSALLRALLVRWFLGEFEGRPERSVFDAWLARWACEEQPAAEDRDLLLELLRSDRRAAQWISVRGLRGIGGHGVDEALRTYARAEGRDPAERAAALLARGDLEQLRARAASDAAAFLAAIELGDDAAWAEWERVAFGADAAAGLAAVEVAESAVEYDLIGPLQLPLDFFERLRAAIGRGAGRLDAARLELLTTIAECARSPELAEAALARLDPEHLGVAPMLELHDEAGLRAALGAWVGLDARHREAALEPLARLGAPEHGAALVEWAEQDADRLLVLARSADSTAVREHLVAALRAIDPGDRAPDFRAFGACAAANGVPERAASSWSWALERLDETRLAERWGGWVDRLARGDGVDLLFDYLEQSEDGGAFWAGLGEVADARVRTWLRKLRHAPEVPVQDVIGELAAAGDPEALAEMAEVRARHLYGWMDDGSLTVRVLGRRVDLVPYWIGEVETVCCRRNGAAGVLDDLFGLDVHEMTESGLRTQHAYAAAWWQRNGPHLRWSRIAERFEVAPH